MNYFIYTSHRLNYCYQWQPHLRARPMNTGYQGKKAFVNSSL